MTKGIGKYVGYWHKFQASGRHVADLGAATGNGDMDGIGGRVYGHGCWVADVATWANGPDATQGRWFTMIGRDSYHTGELEAIESLLFDFAINEGWKP